MYAKAHTAAQDVKRERFFYYYFLKKKTYMFLTRNCHVTFMDGQSSTEELKEMQKCN
jgi:hypothetical protein